MENKIKETEIVVVLDKSGSMGSIRTSTVDGFNEFLNEQKNSEGKAYLTLIQFDDRYEVFHKSTPIQEVDELIVNETYVPRGTTALYESIGRTINELETDRDVVFVIITDGMDNVKSEYNPESLKKMIETLQDENGWKFLYLGANQDAVMAGGSLGVKSSNSMSWAASDSGMGGTFRSVSNNLTSYRMAKASYSADKGDISTYLSDQEENLGFSDNQRNESSK